VTYDTDIMNPNETKYEEIKSLEKEAMKRENSSREELVKRYTVDDLDEKYQQGYDDGWFDAQNDALAEIEDAKKEAYDEGFLAAKRPFVEDPEYRAFVEAGY
jgi:hypothetical protein